MTNKEVKDLVHNYKTNSKYGFIQSEIDDVLKSFPQIKMEKFNNALYGITCMSDEDGNTIIYHCDIYHAILCGIEDRNLNFNEFD